MAEEEYNGVADDELPKTLEPIIATKQKQLLTGIAEYILNREMGDSLEKVSKPVNVEFYTKDGEKVAFKAHEKVSKPVKVEFYTKDYD